MFSTAGDTMTSVEDIVSTGSVQYTGGYHDECRGYHEYTLMLSEAL